MPNTHPIAFRVDLDTTSAAANLRVLADAWDAIASKMAATAASAREAADNLDRLVAADVYPPAGAS